MTKKEKLYSVILDTLKQSTTFDGDYIEYPFTLLYNPEVCKVNLYKSFINHMERRYGITDRGDIKELYTKYKIWIRQKTISKSIITIDEWDRYYNE
jgi:hypothetical protein